VQERNYIQVFFAVQKALFLRELTKRLTQSRIGLFMTFFEPFYQVAFMVILKVLIFGRESENFDYVIFVAIALTGIILFKNILTTSIGAFVANKNLFLYRQVKPIDTIISRVVIEVFLSSIVILIFTTIAFYFEFDTNVENLLIVALAYIWLVVFAFSLGVFFAVMNTYTQVIGNFVKLSMRGIAIMSATFYTLDMLSPELIEILLYNPLVHFMEMLHAGYFYTLDDKYVDYYYMMFLTFIPLILGLWFYTKLEQKIISA
jgi:capsular polysaccharide transport system permease protein